MNGCMDYKLKAEQIKVESNSLRHVTQSLEVVIAWTVEGTDFSRKLSSLRFIAESFQRHLERLFALEELDGYMDTVCHLNPEVSDLVDDLKCEHEQFREAARRLVLRLDHASPADRVKLDVICEDLRDVIRRILEHGHREGDLLVECFNRDPGGEG
jgi:hemerythrin-like domain-containing protein